MNKIFIFVVLLLLGMISIQGHQEEERVMVYDFGEISSLSLEQYELLDNPFVSDSYKLELLYNNRICIDLSN